VSLKEIALDLWPCWMLGIMMLIATFNSNHRDLLRVDISGLLRFAKMMVMVTAFRFFIFKVIAPHDMLDNVRSMVHLIPWQATLGVFWEDAVHVLPLVILGRMFGDRKWYKYISWPLLAMVMCSFGAGHTYQGLVAAIGLSFYIPFSMKMGKKYGFGTVMLSHMMYDLITLLSLAWMVG
jgi:hypothetical protein